MERVGVILPETDLLHSPKQVAAIKIFEHLLTTYLLSLDLIASLVGHGPGQTKNEVRCL